MLEKLYARQMPNHAHIASPKDDTIESRVRYYQSVADAHARVEESLGMLHQKGWADSLGEKDEVEAAAKITANSLRIAVKNLSINDIDEAINLGLLDKNDARQFVGLKRENEMREARERRNSASSQSSQKQR